MSHLQVVQVLIKIVKHRVIIDITNVLENYNYRVK